MLITHDLIATLGVACLIAGCGYEVMALLAVMVWKLRGSGPVTVPATSPAVTLLKPLCGAEERLYENLRSFFLQNYREFQIVFGVRDAADPAIAIVERLVKEFPNVATKLVINAQQHGSNRKVSNLINMLPYARHDVLAIVDSDAHVDETYLEKITAALAQDGVGLVTCTYRSVPAQGLWSRLGAMYINDWYIPSVLLAWLFGHRGFASGQTLCLHRNTLEAIGGLLPIANHLADDYELGERVRLMGLRAVLSDYVTRTEHYEPTLDHLLGHEIRWMRTIRALRPQGFRFLFVSFSLPLAFVGASLLLSVPSLGTLSLTLFAVTVAARLGLYAAARWGDERLSLADLWLVPTRDMLLLWVWWRALRTSRVIWRGHEFSVDAQGVMRGLR
jgi:ceramide glucosyltransferase